MAAKFKIRTGGGSTRDVDVDIASAYEGKVSDVLRRILAEHVDHSDEEQKLLDGPVAFDQCVDGVEMPLSGAAKWSDLIDEMRQSDAYEIGLAQRHIGGRAQ